MAEKLNTNKKTLSYHYREHVLRRGLIKGYVINWMGTGYNSKAERPIHRKHRFTPIEFFADHLNQEERVDLMRKVGQVPYVWLEGAARASYYTKMVFPIDEINEALGFLEGAGRTAARRVLHDGPGALPLVHAAQAVLR